jgi:hypothetical protein
VITVLLSLCAGLIHLLVRLDRTGQNSAELSADLARLSRDFRNDGHQASEAVELGDPSKVRWVRTDGLTVEYEARPADLLRTLSSGGKIRDREIYRLPTAGKVRFDRFDVEGRPFLAFVISGAIDRLEPTVLREDRVETELGRDKRILGGVK